MKANIVLLPGDGIGPEIISAAKNVLEFIGNEFDHDFAFTEHYIGAAALRNEGTPISDETINACKNSDAIILGAVGDPSWKTNDPAMRPEAGILTIRKELDVFANIRPIITYPSLSEYVPVKIADKKIDFVFVRELTSGIYFGEPRKTWQEGNETIALDTLVYRDSEIKRIAKIAFELASKRNKKVTCVDKANVLDTSRLWRKVVQEVQKDYPKIELDFIYVDAAAMYMLSKPESFDVILTSNMFGDILSDEASMLAGSLGLLPSASISDKGPGLYEPIHGSAPDIAGQGIANPAGTILSAAMMLRHSFGLENEAEYIENSVKNMISSNIRTRDIGGEFGTKQFTDKLIESMNT